MILNLLVENHPPQQPYQKLQIPYNKQLPATVLKELKLPDNINWNHGLVIDGSAPNWLYGYLANQLQNAAWVGCYYPQREGIVVIQTHNTPNVEVGEVLNSTKDDESNGNLKLTVDEFTTIEGDRYQCLLIDAVNISPQTLKYLTLPSNIDWNREIVLWGQAPLWLYAYLVIRCQQASWIACYNMKTTEAVVVMSRSSQLIPGDTFKLVPKPPCAAIVFGGPPDSGKSLLAYTLKQTLVNHGWNNKVYLHRVAWDGEGDWFAKTMASNQELANELSKIAGRWKQPENLAEYFSQQAQVIQEIRKYTDLILIDIGGQPKESDKMLLHSATHYIIISNSLEGVAQWHEFFQKPDKNTQEQLIPLAVIHSAKEEKSEVIVNNHSYLEMIVGPWKYEQTETVPQELLEAVKKLIR
ncbi:CRISPR-associated ring nuclease Crn3/Csx3 [Nostoc sp. FACHB-110]|uniref:CRISPR-associated ring nuclease Crn3/Csx3 n=1 Tax=Nostoc sp. FACHB-110 TaxID=2692834 RepID=UPI00168A22BB|nr:CRISPR-associated ring nuclease Crn3/Csx3 [Nostoc sp. FACHB-110]MBD2436235.1 CRISPR-associated protein Csx3 [Nostoc sp. FACHB-110]